MSDADMNFSRGKSSDPLTERSQAPGASAGASDGDDWVIIPALEADTTEIKDGGQDKDEDQPPNDTSSEDGMPDSQDIDGDDD